MKIITKTLLTTSVVLCSFSLTACQSKEVTPNPQKGFENSLVKTIDSGKIKGHKDKENKVIEWLGVPYAQSPEGNLRWKKPQAPKKWKKTRDASRYGEKAIQFNNGELMGSENALNLDLVRPDNKEDKLPIVVYLHGGNNQTGTSQEIKGNTFVNDIDAVYVSVNY